MDKNNGPHGAPIASSRSNTGRGRATGERPVVGLRSVLGWVIEASSGATIVLRRVSEPGVQDGDHNASTAMMAALVEDALIVALQARLAPGSCARTVTLSVRHLGVPADAAALRAEVTVLSLTDQYATAEARLVGPDRILQVFATGNFALD